MDLLTYAEDSGRNGSLISAAIGISNQSRALAEVQRLIASDKLDREGMARLAADLEALDHDFPAIGPAFVNEALSIGMTVRKYGGLPPDWFPARPKTVWRRATASLGNGFLTRGMWADAVMEEEGYMRRIEASDKAEFLVAEKEFARINAEAKATTNPMTSAIFPRVTSYATQHRLNLALLRLSRTAATYRATEQVLELDDPLGTKLLHKKENGKLKFWSVGIDGRDAGGTGGTDDIVLEVPTSR